MHYVSIYCGGKSKRQIQWVWRQALERLLLNRNNKIECPKINRGSGVHVVLWGLWKRGSVLEGRVQVSGGGRTRSPLLGLRRGFVYLLAHGARRDWSARHTGPTTVTPVRFRPNRGSGGSCLWRHGSPSPFLDPRRHQRACTARGRDRSPEERRARHLNSGGDEAPFGSGVPHHSPPALAVSVPLLTLVGSLVKGSE